METEPDRGPNLAGWNLAAALGSCWLPLSLIERLPPPKDQGFSETEDEGERPRPPD